ncbi:MAG: type III-B CRISPR module RAMP protein Cmr1 [Phaeodactylibacter sp.]|nr:type III-B CRISPR module RAMP protein Cmr1 [Phaeodactylibacter sp.]
METITFHCKVITPMFLAGADGRTPELRAPSIKGAMRFWWRAIKADLVESGNYTELKKQEGNLFGGTGDAASRSSFSLQVALLGKKTINSGERLVPHDPRKGSGYAFGPEQQFKVLIRTISQDKADQLIALFQLLSVLGGVGKRSRRGMGAFVVEQVEWNGRVLENSYPRNIDQLLALVKKLSRHFTKQGDKIVGNFPKNPDYPYIKEIEWGKPDSRILEKISQATHDLKIQYGAVYEVTLGHATRGRFASPVYVSVVGGNIPVITTLNTIPDKDKFKISRNLQDDFKRKIL